MKPSRFVTHWTVGVVLMALLISACGGDGSEPSTTAAEGTETSVSSGPVVSTTTPASGSATLSDPCAYVGDSEMSQILGLDVAGTSSDPENCDYNPTAPEESGGIALNIVDVVGSGCEPVFNVAGYGSDGGEPVEDIGSFAKFGDGFVPQLAVCFDDRVTLIASLGAESADPKATLLAAARAFAANLP